MKKTWMIVPDLQVPLHDVAFVDKLVDIASYIKPDGLLFIGDLTDSTEVGRWVKGKAGEYSGKLQASFDLTSKIVSRFRAAVGDDAEMVLQGSNHDSRTAQYIAENAPALSSLRSLDFPRLIGLEDNDVAYVRGVHTFLPGVVSVHGHERAYSSVPGKWGVDRVRDYGANVVYGHTHTPLLISTAIGVGENRKNYWTMNVGHGMDMSQASYLSDGYATWCQAFGLVHHDGERAQPELFMAIDGKVTLGDGRWW
jgi:predicted phosphodiesterase